MNWTDLYTKSERFEENEKVVFSHIAELLYEGAIIYPKIELTDFGGTFSKDLYRALKLTPLEKVRVVILGQDPYHGPGQANGLAFSVNPGIPLPPSLRNIFKEIHNDIGGELRTNGDLSDWAKQGVLLLNSSLSVIEGEPNSMADLWEPVTDEIISFVDSSISPVVFVLWGNNARKKKSLIVNNKAFVVESAHPSPLSANRGFFGSKPFSTVNEILKSQGLEPIIWT